MLQPSTGPALTEIERAIEAEIRNSPPIEEANPDAATPKPPMPEYVGHREGATEIGRLSAEAVVREYESAAKEIEATGAELIGLAMTRNAIAVTEQLKETAARYREEAKRVFLQIENCSEVTAEVRRTCTELREKIASPDTIGKEEKIAGAVK